MRAKRRCKLESNHSRPTGADSVLTDGRPAMTHLSASERLAILRRPFYILHPAAHSFYQHLWCNQAPWQEGGWSIVIFPRPMHVKMCFELEGNHSRLDPQLPTRCWLMASYCPTFQFCRIPSSICNTFDRELSENKERVETAGPGSFETSHRQSNPSFNAIVLTDCNAVKMICFKRKVWKMTGRCSLCWFEACGWSLKRDSFRRVWQRKWLHRQQFDHDYIPPC